MTAVTRLLRAARDAAIGVVALVIAATAAQAQSDPLPSWNDTTPKRAIVGFVERITKRNTPDFVPEPDRIAVFDNDGTLWVEHPMYTQLAFALDRVKVLAKEHPEWLSGDVADAELARMGRGRGIIDFVSSLTDAQTIAFGSRLGGATGLLWSSSL